MIQKSYDIIGNIAILKFSRSVKKAEKIKAAKQLLKQNKSVTTILEKIDKVKGRLRKIKTIYLAGEKTKIAEYKENDCRFRFDVDETYFSPRLSNERKEIAGQVKKTEKVLVMFAGVGPFAVVIAKLAKPKLVVSNEINRLATGFAKENVKLNKLENIEVVQGDSRRVAFEFSKKKQKFDRIVMPRPQLKDDFLDSAFGVVKKGGVINYYGFGGGPDEILKVIKVKAKKARKKVKVLKVKKAGDIGPYKYRWRIDLKVL